MPGGRDLPSGAPFRARRLRDVDYLVALIPSVGTGILFFIVIRAMVNADRNERAALERMDREAANRPGGTEG